MIVAARIEASCVSERSVGMVNMLNPNRRGVALRQLERVMDFVEGVSPEWPSLRRNNGVFADDSRRRVAGSGPGTLKRLISGALRASEPSHDSASPPEVHNRF